MTDVKMVLPAGARGAMATKLLEAADHLGLPASSIRSQTRGFLVPEDVHRYLFPSEYEEADSDPADDPTGDDTPATHDENGNDQYDAMDFPELRETAKNRDLSAGGSAEEIKARLREADATAKASE